MKIAFIGDVMLGRMIGSKYESHPYNLVSEEIASYVDDADYVIANLESPIGIKAETEGDHLQFKGNSMLLHQFNWVSAFSLANNHITDCGILGIDETIQSLDKEGISYNGVFDKDYSPLVLKDDKKEVSIITFTDMLNIPFEKDAKWHVLRMGDESIFNLIRQEKQKGRFVILFAHVGMLFTRYPNPITYNYLHQCVDHGADMIVTCHSHCLGGMEVYKGAFIFHSIGDFCMDGNSMRRRTAAILSVNIENNKVYWEIVPTIVNKNLEIELIKGRPKEKALSKFLDVSNKIARHDKSYAKFFKKQYRKEIFSHSFSTLRFLINERGAFGLIKMLGQRSTEVLRTIRWSLSDRSKIQRDDDAIKANRKKISQKDLFGK